MIAAHLPVRQSFSFQIILNVFVNYRSFMEKIKLSNLTNFYRFRETWQLSKDKIIDLNKFHPKQRQAELGHCTLCLLAWTIRICVVICEQKFNNKQEVTEFFLVSCLCPSLLSHFFMDLFKIWKNRLAGHGLPTESSSPSAAWHTTDADTKGNLTTVLVLCLHTWNKNPAQTNYYGMKG